jgi:tetratricopeptide (TPR) repeat protein
MVLRGNVLARKHLWSEALKVLQTALEIAEKNPSETNQLFLAYLNLGKLSKSQGNWPSASSRLTQALQLSIELGNRNFEAMTHLELGKLYRTMGKWDQSVEHLDNCLRIRRDLGDLLNLAICLHSLGTVWLRQGNYILAKDYFKESINIKEKIIDKYGLAKDLYNLGHIERLDGNFPQALDNYKHALSLYEEIGNQQRISQVLCRLGTTYATMNLWDNALDYINRSRVIRIKAQDKQGISESLFELGVVQNQKGNILEALDSFRLSAENARESSSIGREIPAIVALAQTHVQLNQESNAIQVAMEGRAVAKRFIHQQLLSKEYMKWGNKDIISSQHKAAIFCYAEAIDILLNAHEFVGEYCNQILQGIEQVSQTVDIQTANNLSQQLIEQWKNLSEPDTKKYYLIAIQSLSLKSKEYNMEILKQICVKISEMSLDLFNSSSPT